MPLTAGVATRDISPTRPMQLVGYPHVPRISTGIHDPLLASALYLRRGDKGLLLMALDLLMINTGTARRLRAQVATALGMPEAAVLISCTHTHSAPSTIRYLPFAGDPAMPRPDPAYWAHCEAGALAAALAARDAARPATLGWTTADATGVGGNRHAPDGPADPEVGVLAVRHGERLAAVALIYSMHPTVLHEDSTLVSGDFPYFARRAVQESTGATVLYHTGPCGDQSPRYFVKGQTFSEAERLGRALGAAVLASLPAVAFSEAPRLDAALRQVSLPRRALPTPAEADAWLARQRAVHARLAADGAERARLRTAEVAVFGAEATCTLSRTDLAPVLAEILPAEVQVLRIGDACVVGMPGELFVDYARALKQGAPLRTFVTAYTNGELQGYIVTPAAAAAGGYEAASSLFAPEAGTVLIETALEMLT